MKQYESEIDSIIITLNKMNCSEPVGSDKCRDCACVYYITNYLGESVQRCAIELFEQTFMNIGLSGE